MSEIDFKLVRRLRFDPAVYRRVNTDVEGDDQAVIEHWLTQGRTEEREGRRLNWRSPVFDAAFYLRHRPDAARLIEEGHFASAEEHWTAVGHDEIASGEASPLPGFDEAAYLIARPDVAAAIETGIVASAVDHWLRWGRVEERDSKVMPHRPGPAAQTVSDLSEAKQAFWRRNGYVILEGAISSDRCDAMNALIDRFWTERHGSNYRFTADIFLEQPHSKRVRLADAPDSARDHAYKINDLFLLEPDVRDLALDETVANAIRWILKADPVVVASLNFERGSTQRYHTDTLYMPGLHADSMTAAWFALEDVSPEAGPLQYYPGSHQIPLFRFSNGLPYQINHELPAYDAHMDAHIASLGLTPEMFLPKKGDVLLWHERLYHGGRQIGDMSLTRKSLVCHYWRSDLMPSDQIVSHGGGYYLDRPAFAPSRY